jgi:hypothetical protein
MSTWAKQASLAARTTVSPAQSALHEVRAHPRRIRKHTTTPPPSPRPPHPPTITAGVFLFFLHDDTPLVCTKRGCACDGWLRVRVCKKLFRCSPLWCANDSVSEWLAVRPPSHSALALNKRTLLLRRAHDHAERPRSQAHIFLRSTRCTQRSVTTLWLRST